LQIQKSGSGEAELGGRKISYRSKAPERRVSLKNLTLSPGGKDSHTHPAGQAGFIPIDVRNVEPDMSSLVDDASDDGDHEVVPESIVDKIKDIFIDMADVMDASGDHNSASFVDFLIIKVAESKNFDYTNKLNDLVIKLSESDIFDSNKVIMSLVRQYSRDINRMIIDGEDPLLAKKKAYDRAKGTFSNIIGGGI
jgi:hypothetical protein